MDTASGPRRQLIVPAGRLLPGRLDPWLTAETDITTPRTRPRREPAEHNGGYSAGNASHEGMRQEVGHAVEKAIGYQQSEGGKTVSRESEVVSRQKVLPTPDW